MLLKSPWVPRLANAEGTLSDRIVATLSEDILAGALNGGDRLPAHRELAWSLGIGTGSVTKAYAILERQGIIRSVKGSGTFVSVGRPRNGALIDFSINTLPLMLTDKMLSRTLSAISRRIDSDHVNLHPPPTGHDEHRRLLARWLGRQFVQAKPERLILTGSGQQAIWLAFDILCGGRGIIVTERLGYAGAIALARHRGHPLRSIAMDAEGMCPEDLDRELTDNDTGGQRRLVYVTPTLQNPTTCTMGAARRQAIVDVCRRHSTPIVEDGVYTLGNDPTLLPLVQLWPEGVFHVASLSKSLSNGLRLGVLLAPPDGIAKAQSTLEALPMTSSPVDYAMLEEWVTNGVADTLGESLRAEATRRSHLARTILAGRPLIAHDAAFHIWWPMPHAKAEAITASAKVVGVSITPPDAIRTNPDDDRTGLRLCLGSPSRAEVERGLTLLAQITSGG